MLTETDRTSEQWVTVARGLDEARVNDLALMLTARNIVHQRQRAYDGWELWVPLPHAAAAAAELTQYRLENARAIGVRPLEEVGEGKPGAIAYVAALCVVFVALHQGWFYLDWLGAGELRAGAVLAGQWWRTVTALTVHIELAHLGGNLAFGVFFGYFVGRYLGTGVGWLAVVLAAAGANALNAWLQSPAHRSIGASTAVFAALGLLAAYTWRRGFLRDTPWRSRIAPVVAALGLLAFTGTGGENTDLGAHLLGAVMGFVAGVVLARFVPANALRDSRIQRRCAALTVLLVVGSWVWGLLAAG